MEPVVSTLSIVFMAITLIICIGLPLFLALFFWKKYQGKWFALLIGLLAFTVSQLLIRIPLISVISLMPWFSVFVENNYIIYLLTLSLTAGLFEETARLIGFKIVLKNKLSDENALMFGVGHGGIEAIVLVGLTYVGNIVISLMLNGGLFDAVTNGMTVEQSTLLVSQLSDTTPFMFLFAGIERIAAIFLHIVLSIMVYKGVKSGKIVPYFLAILLHTAVNFILVYFAAENLNISLALTGALAVGCIAYVIFFIRNMRQEVIE